MKVCFPAQRNEGVESRVYNHFGTAPVFVVVDTETNEVSMIINRDQHHAHGSCNPVRALGDHKVDAIVVGGIGGGALRGLNQAGILVYQALGKTVRDNLELFNEERLPQFQPGHVCAGHAGGCSH
jgi:predicted Fe-Mo cluster-binding NifX family protein